MIDIDAIDEWVASLQRVWFAAGDYADAVEIWDEFPNAETQLAVDAAHRALLVVVRREREKRKRSA